MYTLLWVLWDILKILHKALYVRRGRCNWKIPEKKSLAKWKSLLHCFLIQKIFFCVCTFWWYVKRDKHLAGIVEVMVLGLALLKGWWLYQHWLGMTASLSDRMLLLSYMQAPCTWSFHPESKHSIIYLRNSSAERSLNPVKEYGWCLKIVYPI